MRDTPMLNAIQDAYQPVVDELSGVDPDDEERVTELLDEVVVAVGEVNEDEFDDDDDGRRCMMYVLELESLARQVVIHGTPALAGYAASDILEVGATNLTALIDGDVEYQELETHMLDVRSDILAERPNTTVIEDMGIQEEFSAAVRNAYENYDNSN